MLDVSDTVFLSGERRDGALNVGSVLLRGRGASSGALLVLVGRDDWGSDSAPLGRAADIGVGISRGRTGFAGWWSGASKVGA